MRKVVNKMIIEGKTFYYLDVGEELHGRKSFRLYVSSKLVEEDENGTYLRLPRENVDLKVTEKGTRILIPGNCYAFSIVVPAGYRGGSNIEILSAVKHVLPYKVYSSPRGNLGISEGVIVISEEPEVKFYWERTGRTYGNPKQGIAIINLNGEVTNIDDATPETLEDLKEFE